MRKSFLFLFFVFFVSSVFFYSCTDNSAVIHGTSDTDIEPTSYVTEIENTTQIIISDTEITSTIDTVSPSTDTIPITSNDTEPINTTDLEKKYHTITWLNFDGTVLKTEKIEDGSIPSFGEPPTKPEDEKNTYVFTEWYPTISVATQDITYTAQYSPLIRKYTVLWLNYDNSVLKLENVEYGKIPSFGNSIPFRTADKQYSYTFSGWSQKIEEVTGDITFFAQFNKTINKYNVVWKNYDGSIIKTETIEYGSIPSNTLIPERIADKQFTYSFSGWSPEIKTVTEDIEYTALYSGILNKYSVIWKDSEGYILKSEEVEYGAMPYFDSIPTKADNNVYSYFFSDWYPAVECVTDDVVYTAKFQSVLKQYNVVWKDSDGNVLKTERLTYGSIPAYGSIPQKEQDGTYSYAFSGWSPAIEAVTKDIVYTAQFTFKLHEYQITWKNYDGTILSISKVQKGQIPQYKQTVTRPDDDLYEYVFIGWSPEIEYVVEDKTYTAVFEKQPIKLFYYTDSTKTTIFGLTAKGQARSELSIPDGVTAIKEYAFNRCKNIVSITIPNSVTKIGNYAFAECTNLASIELPGSIVTIGDYAFYKCSNLTDAVISEGITHIGSSMFQSCTNLKRIILPNTLTGIGIDAFCNCLSLTEITIPKNVTSIGAYAFEYCQGLKTIIIPKNVSFISWNAFQLCTALTDIYCESSAKPEGWNEYWAQGCSATIHWGHKET